MPEEALSDTVAFSVSCTTTLVLIIGLGVASQVTSKRVVSEANREHSMLITELTLING